MIEHFILLWNDLTTPTLTPLICGISFFMGSLIMWLSIKLEDEYDKEKKG